MPGELEPGTVLGEKYRVGPPLNEGGFARLYAAERVDGDDGIAIAIKVLLRTATQDDAAAYDRFDREAQVAEVLSSPNTVRTFDHGRTSKGQPYLVMERLDGVTLDRILAQGPQSGERVRRILMGVLGSLAEAHEVGVVHRDLKLANIFLCPTEESPGELVKVIDFGLAKVLDHGETLDSKNLTADGILVGTPGYMAPELLLGGEVTPQSDLYVVGLIGHELLTGELGYDGSPLTKARAQMKGNPSAAKEIAQTPLYQTVVKRLLERKPAKRFWDARQAMEVLENLDLDAKPSGGFWKRLVTRH